MNTRNATIAIVGIAITVVMAMFVMKAMAPVAQGFQSNHDDLNAIMQAQK